ncbi:MAG: hypothetical protein LBK53_09875 [Heliobacteriaceae bacterium]|jgi:hypothetical protein|nr:hypothetical protein [Heliobacteriaceae bacterium]
MAIQPVRGDRFYNFSADFERNVLMNRALIAGVNDVAWVAMANNNVERWEKIRRFSVGLTLSFLAPILTLPLSNRIGMKYGAKLTKSFRSDNHKAVHLSNEFLGSADKMKEGLEILKNKYTFSPLERLWSTITGKKLERKPLDFNELLEKCGNDPEKLRRKLVNTKAGILAADVILSSLPFGSIGFVNNRITKKKSGQSGFSAEFKMADKELVEKRAQNYEKTWKKRYAVFAGSVAAMTVGLPLLIRGGLLSKNPKALMKKNAHLFDYEKGIYMSRLSLTLFGVLLGHFGNFLATRNKTELKDNILRYGLTDTIFLGGDLLLASVFMNMSDKLFDTKLTKEKKNLIQKVLPKYKSLEEVGKEGKSLDKKVRLGVYWANLAIITAIVGFGVPAFVNSVIRKDVEKDKQKQNKNSNTEFYKKFILSGFADKLPLAVSCCNAAQTVMPLYQISVRQPGVFFQSLHRTFQGVSM